MSAEQNRRASDRLNERGIIFLEMPPAADSVSDRPSISICQSLDISTSGLRVCLDAAVVPGVILQLGIELGELGETIYLVSEVVRCIPTGPGGTGFEVAFQLLDSDGTDIDAWRALIEELQ